MMSKRKNERGVIPPQTEVNLTDPFAQREAEKYARPIPSRELIIEALTARGQPQNLEELRDLLAISDEESIEALRRRLRAMERDGQLVRNRRDEFCIVNSRDLVAGRVIAHPDGFGFVRPDDGGDDLFLSPNEMRALIHNDRVVVNIRGLDRRGRREGSVVQILERNTQHVVGRLHHEKGVAFVVPDNRHITHEVLIAPDDLGNAKAGQIVLAQLLAQPSRRGQPIGKVVEILGEHMAPGMEIEIAIRSYDLPSEWPAEVLAESNAIPVEISEGELAKRVDLRNRPFVTIDGEDARDFDDAVYCERKPKGWKLWVAIADVSHYVMPCSQLDAEAQKRGTSVYFPGRVVPMLPEVLSNGLCSLNPDEDRLCMVCEAYIDQEGKLLRSSFHEGVIRSHARLTYTEVNAVVFEKESAARERREHLLAPLESLADLFKALRSQRERRGAIDFETQETRIVFGADRKIAEIVPAKRNQAHQLIEECMIVANIAAARFLKRQRVPHLLRTHDGPTEEKLSDVRAFLKPLGVQFPVKGRPEPKHYADVIRVVSGRPDEHLIQTVLLRSLSQAVYSPEEKSHFGLAVEAYTHFTSPIRRYPDLLVHRGIRHSLRGLDSVKFGYSRSDMVVLGEHCSAAERRADEATRDAVAWLKCEFMLDRVGEEFDGIVSGVTSFGLFVELRHIFVEGLIHISNLGRDFFHFDPVTQRLTGERSGQAYRLGDPLRIRVARVDLDDRKIDFDLVHDAKPTSEKPRARKRRRR